MYRGCTVSTLGAREHTALRARLCRTRPGRSSGSRARPVLHAGATAAAKGRQALENTREAGSYQPACYWQPGRPQNQRATRDLVGRWCVQDRVADRARDGWEACAVGARCGQRRRARGGRGLGRWHYPRHRENACPLPTPARAPRSGEVDGDDVYLTRTCTTRQAAARHTPWRIGRAVHSACAGTQRAQRLTTHSRKLLQEPWLKRRAGVSSMHSHPTMPRRNLRPSARRGDAPSFACKALRASVLLNTRMQYARRAPAPPARLANGAASEPNDTPPVQRKRVQRLQWQSKPPLPQVHGRVTDERHLPPALDAPEKARALSATTICRRSSLPCAYIKNPAMASPVCRALRCSKRRCAPWAAKARVPATSRAPLCAPSAVPPRTAMA